MFDKAIWEEDSGKDSGTRSREYIPDVWVIVRISGSEVPETYYRVLAGWYGGFADGDSWRLSSGIENIKETEGGYEASNASGSLYYLSKGCEGFSNLTRSVYGGYQFRKPEEFSVERVTMEELRKEALPVLFEE